MEPILQVQGLGHTYSAGTPFEHIALQDVSFSVNKGELIGIIGHTGSGKSTLLQHLNGLLKPTCGTVLVDGRSIHSDKKYAVACRFRVGLVFQYPEYQLFEETVYKDIAFGPKNMGLSEEEIRRRVSEAAQAVGLDEQYLESSPFDLSGGQKRRVAIAGVMAMEPEVLILDEPTAGLDPEGREGILNLIEAYRRNKQAAVMIVSHSMADMAARADRLLVMNRSRLVMDGTPKEVFARADELVAMGLDIPEITRVFLKLRDLGLPVEPVYSVEQGAQALLKLKEEMHRA